MTTQAPVARSIPWRLSQLAPVQRQVVALVAKGMTDEDIAEHLHMPPGSVKRHITSIADTWKQAPIPRSPTRIRIALCFMLAEGHLKRIDWPIPELTNVRLLEPPGDLEKREAVLAGALTGGFESAAGTAKLTELFEGLTEGGQRWVMTRMPLDLVDRLEPRGEKVAL